MEEAARLLLMALVFPLWVAAGFADWLCHRRSNIAATSGLKENLFHWLQLGQMGLAILAVALLEVNAAILLLVFAAFLAHELTTWMELRYVVPLRRVGPTEQMVHSFLEILPLVALVLLLTLHWDQALALLDAAPQDSGLRWKEQPLPASVLWGGLAAALLFNLLPMAEESWRCWRGRTASR